MSNSKISFFIKAISIGMALLAQAESHAADIKFDLSGVGSSVNGYGRDGLYLGSDFNSNFQNKANNWTFDAVTLSINDMTGEGTIHGGMTYQSDHSSWTFDMSLANLFVTKVTNTGVEREAYNSASHDLSAILTPSSKGTGIEWGRLTMTTTSPSHFWGGSNPAQSTWSGLAMPEEGHVNVAELTWQENFIGSGVNGLVFDAWYQRQDCPTCAYKVGDSKALAVRPEVSAVPIPGALVLFVTGLLGFAATARRNENQV